jgi:hypothetical protein
LFDPRFGNFNVTLEGLAGAILKVGRLEVRLRACREQEE